MTRRERLEAKLAKRAEWAEKREAKAAAVACEGERYRGDVAFNTQPGHIPERARLIAREERAFGNLKMAKHHRGRAAGLAAQLDAAVYSDDADAIEALEARATEREAQADRYVAINRAWRKLKAAPTDTDRVAQLVAQGVCSEALAKTLAETMRLCPWLKAPLDTANLRASARRDRERIAQVKARQAKTAQADAAPGGVVVEADGTVPDFSARNADGSFGVIEYVRVTFAEKPDRAVLDALRTAGFRWGAGSWSGRRDRLPACAAALATTGGQGP